VLLSFFNCTES